MNVAGALSAGFTVKQILNYLGQAFPELGLRIKDAVKAGKSAEDIVKYLSDVDKGQLIKHRGRGNPVRVYPEEPSENPFIAASRSQKEYSPVPESLETAGKVGLGLAAGYGASKILPKALQGIGTFISSNIGPKPMSNAPGVSTASPQAVPAASQSTPESNILPQQQQSLQPTASQISPENSIRLIEQMNIGPQILTLHQAGNNPEAISAAIGVSLKPHQRKWLDEQIKEGKAKSLPDLITDYIGGYGEKTNTMASQPVEEASQGKKSMRTEFPGGHYEGPNWEGTGAAKRHPGIKAGNVVATPGGDIGTVKSERNGKALVDVDGKMRQEEVKHLEMPNEELIQAVENLLQLPEIEKSAIISSLVYRPSKKEMFVKFHNGERYVYEDVDEEEIRPIADAMGIPVTTGKNIYGAWEKGKQDSRGAALIHGIIRNPKYAKDKEGKTWEKLETKYDRHKKLYKQPKRKRSE